MNRNIYIIRHAEANSATYGLVDDVDRTLNANGIADAKLIGKCFSEKKISFDKIVTSSASRAIHTGIIVARSTNFDIKKLTICDKLYLASVSDIVEAIKECPDDCFDIAIVAHNPGVSDLAFKTGQFINVKTSGVLHYSLTTDSWEKLTIDDFQFEGYDCN